jgi:hypothetical protein
MIFAFKPCDVITQGLVLGPQHLAKGKHLPDLFFQDIKSIIHGVCLPEKRFS